MFSPSLLARALELLPPGPPGCRPRDVREGLREYSAATVQNAVSHLARTGRAACSGPIGARRYWRAQPLGRLPIVTVWWSGEQEIGRWIEPACPETHGTEGGQIPGT